MDVCVYVLYLQYIVVYIIWMESMGKRSWEGDCLTEKKEKREREKK
jgi:hypothetical protein